MREAGGPTAHGGAGRSVSHVAEESEEMPGVWECEEGGARILLGP